MWSCKKGLRGGLILQMQCHIGHQSNQDNFKQHMLENSCFLASPGSFPHRQVLQVQKIQKFSLLLCSDSHPLWQPVCFTVLPFWLAQGLLLTATLLGTFLLAAVSLLLSPGTSTCRVRKVTFPFFIVVAVLSHFSLQKQILSTYLLLNFSIFPAFHTHLAPLQCHYGRLVFFFPNTVLKLCMLQRKKWLISLPGYCNQYQLSCSRKCIGSRIPIMTHHSPNLFKAVKYLLLCVARVCIWTWFLYVSSCYLFLQNCDSELRWPITICSIVINVNDSLSASRRRL